MSSFTVTITEVASDPSSVLLPLRTPLGQLVDALKHSDLFEPQEILEFSETLDKTKGLEERDMALAWFYKYKVLPKDPEQIVEISALFEELLDLDAELDRLDLLEQGQRSAEAAKRALQMQAEAAEKAVDGLREDLASLESRVRQYMDYFGAADAALDLVCEQAMAGMDPLAAQALEMDAGLSVQSKRWEQIGASCRKIGGGS